MDKEIKASLTAGESWIRGLYMLLFAAIYSVAEMVLAAVAILQFIFLLVARGPNERLQEFGDDLSTYFYEMIQFLTFNTEDKPFPFGPWPSGNEEVRQREETVPGNEPVTSESTQVADDDTESPRQ